MQRGKKKLHVDTFPFLAVLLCAMGSLILLLMVMDRRAKAVARHKIAQQMEARQEQKKGDREGKLKDALANGQADWEKERDQLHATLAAQEEELRSQLAGMVHEVKGAEQKVETKQTEFIFLQQKLAQEYERLLKDREKLGASLNHLSAADKKAAQAGEQMRRATMELLQLEQALRELKELRSRPSNAYSLVPFSGKRGDSRKPVYVECYAEGIVMHPNRTLMQRDDLTVQQFRDEIQKRAGQLEREKEWDRRTLTPPPTNAHAYVLFLVRPDGIDTYWTAQTALRGYAIDYGYEFVDTSWSFDFSSEDAVAGQPWNNYGTGPGKVRPMLVSNRPGWPGVPGKGRPGFGTAGLEGPPGSASNGNGGPGSGDSGYPGPGGSGPGSGGMSGSGSQGTPFNSLAPGNGFPGNGPKGPPGMKYGSGSGAPVSGSGSLAGGLSGSGYGSGPPGSGTGQGGTGTFGQHGSKPGAYTNGLSGPGSGPGTAGNGLGGPPGSGTGMGGNGLGGPPGSGTGMGGNGLGGPPGSGTGVAGSGLYGPPGSQPGSPASGLPGTPGFGPPGSGPGASGIGSLTSGLSGPPGSNNSTPGSGVGGPPGSGTGTLGNGQAGTGPGTPGNGPPGSGPGSPGNGQTGNAGTGLAMLGAPTFGMPNAQGGSTFGDPTDVAGGPGSGGDGGLGIGNGNGTGGVPGNGPAGLGSGNGGPAGSSGTGIPQVGSRPNAGGTGVPPTVIAGDPGLPKFDGSTAKAGTGGGNQYGYPSQAGGVPGQGDPNATGAANGPGSPSPRPAYSIWSPGTVSAMGASGNAGPSSPPGMLQSALFPQNPGNQTGQQQGAGNGPPGNSFAVPSVGGNGNVANAGSGTGQNNPLRPPGQNAGSTSSESAYGNFGGGSGSGSDGGGVPSGGGGDGQPSSPLNIGTGGAAPNAGGGGPSKTAPGTALPENVAQGSPSIGGGAPSIGGPSRGGNRQVPRPPGRLMGNHDYVITLECRPDGVVIYPRFYLYPLNPASNQKNVEQALVRDVQQLITRRQASVRPGETPFRPMIRLQVAPDGVRAYYWIYPALQQLNVPMFRENAEN